MKEYVCKVCGYVHKTDGEIPNDFVCPLCGAGKDAFVLKDDTLKSAENKLPKPHVDKQLSAMEMSIICSNLARGCEKQYMPKEMENFAKLAKFFRGETKQEGDATIQKLVDLIQNDLSNGFAYGNAVAKENNDRGALRCQVWAEKVSRMLLSLLARYEKEGDKMLQNTGVYVCTACGFVFVGDEAPQLCPVCKVPSWKFEKQERRAK